MPTHAHEATTPKDRDAQVAVRPVAVVDIGTTSIRMAVAQIAPDGGIRTLDSLSQAVSLGRDTFTKGSIDKATIEDCVRVLKNYRRVLEEYGVTDESQLRVVATTAVREAGNRLAFLDRVHIATGMRVDVIDDAEVSRLTYLGVQPFLGDPSLAGRRAIVTEVGGGNTEILVIDRGDVAYSQTYRLGAFRLRKTLEAYGAPTRRTRNFIDNHVRRVVDQIHRDVPVRNETPVLVALGGDIRFAASQLLPEWSPETIAGLPLDRLEPFTDEVLSHSVDDLVRMHPLTWQDAEALGPSLLAYVQLARAFEQSRLLVIGSSLRDGLLTEMAAEDDWIESLRNQIIRSALVLGRRYDLDEAHARHAAHLSLELFKALQDEHRLGPRSGLILYVAALLHDIGNFISNRSHHKHSMYLIRNSELFGLGKTDVSLVALVARYHRRAAPKPLHEGYAALDSRKRIIVSKLAAILRVADALDRTGTQRIDDIRCTREDGRLVISVPNVEDLAVEKLALKQKGSLFEDVYGLKVQLRAV